MATDTTAKALNDQYLKEQLQILRQADNITNLWYIVVSYIYLITTIGLTIAFFEYREQLGAPWWTTIPITILAVFMIGAGQHQLTGLGHEGSHHSLFKNKKWNEFASDVFCMFPVYSTTHFYRLQHLAHHQFVNDPEKDPDVSQLIASGHWLGFPAQPNKFYAFLLKQLWLPNVFKFMLVRAIYSSTGTDANPYVKKSSERNKLAIRIGMIYVFGMIPVLAYLAWIGNTTLLATIPTTMWLATSAIFLLLPNDCYQQSKVHSVFSSQITTFMRITYISVVFNALAWLYHTVSVWAPVYYFLLWLVPIFTTFSFFMILRQVVQHGNGDRGWLTNTRIFFVNKMIQYCVFPMGQDYHLPHHLYSTVPHYRLRKLHEILLRYPEYEKEAVEVHGYFVSPEKQRIHPTVVDVLGDSYSQKTYHDVHIDNTVLDDCEVEDKQGIINVGIADIENARKKSTTNL
jgi:fatty acid desaturase